MHSLHHEPYAELKHPICRFLVQGLSSVKGRARHDFIVELVLSVDGLLTLVKSVHGILNKHHSCQESYRNLRWRLHFHGNVFTFADPEIHQFHLLQYPLRNGQTGWFEGGDTTFRFTVENIHEDETYPCAIANYPKLLVVPQARNDYGSCASDAEDEWLSDELKTQAREFQTQFREYMSGANIWSQNASGEYFRDKAKPPKWTSDEEGIMSLLIQSGSKFQESWQTVLQHCFVNRSEVGTAQQWYKVRKRQISLSSVSSDQVSKEDMVTEAKRMCLGLLERHLNAGVPKLEEHPIKRKCTILGEAHNANSLVSPLKRRRTMDPSNKRKGGGEGEQTGQDGQVMQKKKRPRSSNRALEEIATSSHYHVSFMHKANLSHVVSSARHGYVVTSSDDGIVKFWKRTSVEPPEDASKSSETTTPCLEFVKSFTAHVGPVLALCLDPSEDTVASIGEDSMIKIYDISTFDATAMVKTTHSFGRAACFLQDGAKDSLLAIGSSSGGDIHVYSTTTLQLVQTLSFHSSPVTCVSFSPHHQCCISSDKQGSLEVWDCTSGSSEGEVVGASCSVAKNGFQYKSKASTDLYSLAKKSTYARALTVSKNYFVVYGADHKIRVFQLATGKALVRYDERLTVYASKGGSMYGMDSIEFGKREATEREMEQQSDLPLSQMVQMDPSERYLLISTMVGVKVIEWKTNKLVKTIGKADASQLRFLSFSLCPGDAKMNQQMQLARGSGTSTAMGERKVSNDALVVALAYHQRRFYVFSTIDPFKEGEENGDVSRDVWNEAPTAQDQMLGSEKNGGDGAGQAAAFSKAILRTTMGDIHFKLFPEVSKTLENFCGHARSGYYDNVIFHRIIQGFMLQTGDPLGDGTGGESIWGGEFEDEFVRELRHDRPFTVSMANAGPNTNGSQFFITTVPTPWLDNKHTVFGRVTKGMDICTMIENVKTDKMDKPLDEIKIVSVDVE